MNRARIAAVCLLALAALAACESQTGPDAPARTNGCIDTNCNPDAPKEDAGSDGG